MWCDMTWCTLFLFNYIIIGCIKPICVLFFFVSFFMEWNRASSNFIFIMFLFFICAHGFGKWPDCENGPSIGCFASESFVNGTTNRVIGPEQQKEFETKLFHFEHFSINTPVAVKNSYSIPLLYALFAIKLWLWTEQKIQWFYDRVNRCCITKIFFLNLISANRFSCSSQRICL